MKATKLRLVTGGKRAPKIDAAMAATVGALDVEWHLKPVYTALDAFDELWGSGHYGASDTDEALRFAVLSLASVRRAVDNLHEHLDSAIEYAKKEAR
jgi:hypothetical protein